MELEGMALEEGSDSGADPSFLLELMELNEAVEDAQTPEEADRIGRDTKVKLEELTDQIDGALNRGEHEAAKALLIRMKYFATVEEKESVVLSKQQLAPSTQMGVREICNAGNLQMLVAMKPDPGVSDGGVRSRVSSGP
ncbi:unnamed protein product [Gadus morhua 'NCC']